MARLIYLILVVFAALVPSTLAVRDVAALFVVDVSTNDNGGCRYVGTNNLNRMVNDAYRLADTSANAIGQYGNQNVAWVARLYEAFFNQGGSNGLQSDQRITIRDSFRSVYRWLRDGGNINGGRVATKPHLFCDSNFLIRQSMEDIALQSDGKEVKDNRDRGVKIKNIPKYIEARRKAAKALKMSESRVVPYWNKISRSYEFDVNHGGGVNDGPCGSADRVGGYTVSSNPFPHIVLCPRSFRLDQNNRLNYRPIKLSAENRPTGSAVSVVSQVENGAVDGVRRLSSIEPTAATFLHECFHLVLGVRASYPTGGEIYKIDIILRLEFGRASVNPESYTTLAIALYNTLTSADDGVNLFWHTGYATRD